MIPQATTMVSRLQKWNRSGVLILLFNLMLLPGWAQSPCLLTCNHRINVSLDENCERLLRIDDVLERAEDCQNLQIVLSYPYGTHTFSYPGVDRSHLGYTFIYRVLDTLQFNSCWGYIQVEDKYPPQPACKSIEISCFQVAQFNQIIGVIQDNCSQEGRALINKLNWVEYGCDSAILGRVYRTIRTFDQWGNSSECKDTLRIRKDSLHLIKCPDHLVLNCRVKCKQPTGAGHDLIQFSSDPTHANYPSPEFLLRLQSRDTFNSNIRTCISRDSLVVPAIKDLVIVAVAKNTPYPAQSGLTGLAVRDTCIQVDSCVLMWSVHGTQRAGLCKVNLGYKDQILPLCGSGFKIRREWKIADWCANRDTTCVQYIKIDDYENPIVLNGKKEYYATVNQHDCIVPVTIEAFTIDDCSPVSQSYSLEYKDSEHGKKIVLEGNLPVTLKLPASGGIFGRHCFDVLNTLADPCLNKKEELIKVCISDISPPSPLCDEKTQITVDPATCWARIYAKDLDNGSRDNCCNVLHFAVAPMDSISTTRNAWTNYWTKTCNSDYWKYKKDYDAFLEDYINCFIFKDYLDLTSCGENQVVLRVYEACGIPRYDPHVFPCSEHTWFTYNNIPLCRAWINYTRFHPEGKKSCDAKPEINWCRSNWQAWFLKANMETKNPLINNNDYPGEPTNCSAAQYQIHNTFFEGGWDGCAIENRRDCIFYFNPIVVINLNSTFNPGAPGNTCSKLLYNECMIIIKVDDKTPPVCETPPSLYWYCDNVTDVREIKGKRYFFNGHKYNKLESAKAVCGETFTNDLVLANGNGKYDYDPTINASDGSCEFNHQAYQAIECEIEFDDHLQDTVDATGKAFGWYGCNIYGPAHQAEHGDYKHLCEYSRDRWSPVYCHTWLCLDRRDSIGKTDPRTAFYKPVMRSGGRGQDAEPGQFIIWDNCWVGDPVTKDESYIDQCGNGWLKRTWTVKDKCNTTITCEQKIITRHRSDFEVEFPKDVSVNCLSSGSLAPEVTGRPVIMDDDCELVGLNYEDIRYDIVPDACYKIVRTWKLIDWCKFDPNAHDRYPEVIVDDRKVADTSDRFCVYRHLKDEGDGYMTYTQIIKVVDNEAPVLNCRDSVLCSFVNGCKEKFLIPFTAADNCTPAALIGYRWELDAGANGSIEKKSNISVKNFNEELGSGIYRLTVFASDHCGNTDTCHINLTVKDCKKPTPYCYNGISTVIMPNTGEITIWAKDFNAGSFDNCTQKDKLKFYFGAADCTKPGPDSMSFSCRELGTQILCVFVVDEAGNTDFCTTYVLIQDNNTPKICVEAHVASFGGSVNTENAEPVQNVQVELRSAAAAPSSVMTSNDGKYQFSGLDVSKSYLVVPDRNADWMNGVSTLDLVVIQQHIMGVKSLTSKYKHLAADVNNSKDIDVVDLVELRKLILGIYEKLPNNKSWRFADKSVTGGLSPYVIKEVLEMKGIPLPSKNYDFVGIKIGDVNESVTAHQLMGMEFRTNAEDIIFSTEEIKVEAGKSYDIPIRMSKAGYLIGYQFTLQLDPKTLEYTGYKKGKLILDPSHFGYTHLKEGLISTSWNSTLATLLNKDDVLFFISVKAKTSGMLSRHFSINSKIIRSEAYTNEVDSRPLKLEFKGSMDPDQRMVLYQNSPNPFNKQTVIAFELPQSGETSIIITDIAGKTLKVIQGQFGKGYNQVELFKEDFQGTGVRYYKLIHGNQFAIKKMVLLE